MAKTPAVPALPFSAKPIDLQRIWRLLMPPMQEASSEALRALLVQKYGANQDLDESMSAVMNAQKASGIRLNRADEQALVTALRYAALRVLLAGYGLMSPDSLQDGHAFLARAMEPHWLKRWATLPFDDAVPVLTNLLSPRQMLFVFSRFASEVGEAKLASIAERAALTGESLSLSADDVLPRDWWGANEPLGPVEALGQDAVQYVERLSRGEYIGFEWGSLAKHGWDYLGLKVSKYGQKTPIKILRSATPMEWISLIRGSAR